MTPRGAVTLFPLRAGKFEYADGITSGPDGNLWFALSTQQRNGWVERIAKMTTSGVITAFRALTPPLYVGAIDDLTTGPDKNVWFTESHACAGVGPARPSDLIGRITPDGRVRMFALGAARGAVSSLTRGPDGNLWFTMWPCDEAISHRPIGRMTPAGAPTFFRAAVEPSEITAGSDGNLWFTQPNQERIGRITPEGVVSEFPPAPTMSSLRQRGAGISVRLRCPKGAPMACRGTVALEQGEGSDGRRLGAARFAIAPRRAMGIRVPLWARGRQLLAAAGKLSVNAVIRPRSLRTKGLGGRSVQPVVLRLLGPPPVTG
jgi:streptogramin lyase